MHNLHAKSSFIMRIIFPLLIAIVIVAATVLISGSSLIRIEDVYANRIIAGTYGTPDWRVQEMNPLLSQFLTLLYRIIPSVNWYGALLLLLLALASAAAMGLTGGNSGLSLPATCIIGPILVVIASSLQSTVVCAICAGVGSMALMDGLSNRKEKKGRIVVGIILYVFAAMLSLTLAAVLAACAALCWLPCCVRDGRVKGVAMGAPLLAVIVLVLFGYSSLMYGSAELSAYRNDYALYERLQHSSLKEESEALVSKYGVAVHYDYDGHSDEDQSAGGADDAQPDEAAIEPNSFDAVGWSINDASLFFSRYSADTALTDPETLRTLEKEARFISFDLGHLAVELFTTLKKPQFLLLIAFFVLSALVVVVTSRRKGLIALLTAIIAFGGHILTLARYYDTFADIAPFYLLGIAIMLYHFDGDDAKAWYHRVIGSRKARVAVSAAVLVCFAAGLGGILYYARVTPANADSYTVEAAGYITEYIENNPDTLFIGDNPNDRVKPDTLAVPVRGQDQNLLAGSYDLYSPRAAALLSKYSVTNPLTDCVGRDDIGYISMSLLFNSVMVRLDGVYEIYLKETPMLLDLTEYGKYIFSMVAYEREEFDVLLEEYMEEQEQAALWAEALQDLEDQGFFDETDDDHTHETDETGSTAGPVQGGTVDASPTPQN